jgi:hypothetical protein
MYLDARDQLTFQFVITDAYDASKASFAQVVLSRVAFRTVPDRICAV